MLHVMRDKCVVSVIIPARNEESHIRACIRSVHKQTYAHVETVVVDNASTDATKAIAKKLGARVYDKGPERSAQRNFGVSKATGTYFVFIDADMELTPKVIEECVEAMQKSQKGTAPYQAMVIPEKSKGKNFLAQCKALERTYYEGVEWIEAARFYKRSAFIRLGGYDETLTGPEDFDLPQKLKASYGHAAIGRISAYIIHNEDNISLWALLKKKYYYGKRMYAYSRKTENRFISLRQANLFSRLSLFFSDSDRLFKQPAIGVGMLVMKIMETTALFLGYIRGRFA